MNTFVKTLSECMTPERALISDTERKLRQATVTVLDQYTDEYVFHTSAGRFNERLIKHLNSWPLASAKWFDLEIEGANSAEWLRSSIYATLIGCHCKDNGLGIPQRVREAIENEIIARYLGIHYYVDP